jgi:hypothetical protein
MCSVATSGLESLAFKNLMKRELKEGELQYIY